MSKTSSRILLALLFGTLCLQCSDSTSTSESSSSGEGETILLIAIDDLRADHLKPYGYPSDPMPRLTELAASGTVLEDFITSSTATNAAVASLFTGLEVDRHGVRSLQDFGRHRLPRACETLAEEFAARDFATIGAVSLRQLEGKLSGLDQGFECWIDAGLPRDGRPLPASKVVARLERALEKPFDANRSVFAFLHLGDLRESDAASGRDPLPWFADRLRAYGVTPDVELAKLLDGADPTELDAAAEIEALIGRRRGTDEWRAWRDAIYDAALFEVDRALGRLLDHLEAHDRRDGLRIAIVGTRGRYLTEPRPDGALEGLSEGLIGTVGVLVPSLPDEPSLEGPCDTPFLTGWVRGEAGALSPRTFLGRRTPAGRERDFGALVDSPRVSCRALVIPTTKWIEQLWADRNPIVDRATETILTGEESTTATDWMIFLETAPRSAFGIAAPLTSPSGYEDPLAITLELWPGRKPHPSGVVSIVGKALPGAGEGPEGWTVWESPQRRDAEFRLTIPRGEVEPIPRDYHAHLREVLAVLPIPRLPASRGEEWGEADAEPWLVDVAAAERRGLEITVSVEAGEPGDRVRVWAVRYGPTDDVEGLRVDPDSAIRVLSEESLAGAAVVEGTVPFTMRVEREPNARLAMAVEVEGRMIPAEKMRYLGRRFVDEELVLYFPKWLPQRMDWFLDPDDLGVPPDATISIRRTGEAPLMEGRLDLTLEEARFLRRLGRNE